MGLIISATFEATRDPRLEGSGRPLVVGEVRFKRRRGRPCAPLDQLVGHVIYLQALDPSRKLTDDIIADVAAFHGVDPSSVWKALKEHDPQKPVVLDLVISSRHKISD